MTKLKATLDKKVSIILSVIIMVVSLLIAFPFSTDAWDGSASSAFASGSGTEASPYVINTKKQMGYFMSRLNAGITYEGQYIKLNANLDMTGGNWNVDQGTVFAGTFLGNNKTLTMDKNFLGTIAEGGKVDWLNLNGAGTLSDPLLCYTNNGTIQNCRVRGDVNMTATSNAGLLCSSNNQTGVIVNSCGFGSVYGVGDDSDCYVGWIGQSNGTIKNCYVTIELSGSAPGRYNSLYTGQITAKGSYENCYYGADVIKNDASFVAALNKSVGVPGYIWAVDSNNVNEGYPVIKSCLSAMTNLSSSADYMVPFHSTTFSASLSSSETGCTIYYTLDGTDPTTSSTRKKYSSPFTISGDTLITSVAYKNGSYGVPNRQQMIQLLGSGTSESPYIISTNKQLYAIRFDPDKIYELIRDLDFTNEPFIYQGENWESIPTFSGELRGNGHSITGLSSITGGLVASNQGLIQELRLTNHRLSVYDTTAQYAHFGAIANSNSGTITRCYAGTDPNDPKSIAAYYNYIGGIAGYNSGTISYCSSSGMIRLFASWGYCRPYLGGIAGYGTGTVQSCYSDMTLYTMYSAHDLGLTVGGIACNNRVYDSRFDGVCVIDSYTASFGVGSAALTGDLGYSYRIFNGGATFMNTGSSSRNYYTQETDLYSYIDLKESSYSAFDFDNIWMMTDDGPMPQGIMDADGHCMAKYSYTEPTCVNVGSAVSYDMLNTSYRETYTLPLLSHSYSVSVTDPTCTVDGYTTYTCNCGDSYVADEVSALGHTNESAVVENKIDATCTTDGSYDSAIYCSVCGVETSRETKIIDKLGHSYTTNGDCSVCGEYRATFSGASLTLEDNIAVNFKVAPEQFDGTEYTNPYVVFTFNETEFVVTDYTLDSNGRYAFTFSDIAPRMMNDSIVATLYATYEGESVACQTRSYSVKEYCYNMLSRCNEGGIYADNEKFKALLVDLLNYGEAAQIYGSYNIDNLVTKDLTDTQKSYSTEETPTISTVQNLTHKTIETPSVTWKAGGLLLEDAVTMRFKFHTSSIEGINVKFYTDSNPSGWIVGEDELVETSGGYYVYFDGLKARQMRETVYVTVYLGDIAISNTVSYSIESYAYAKMNDSNTKLTALLEAMMKYGDSAYRYINE